MKPLIVHRKGEVLLGQKGLTLEDLPLEFQKVFPEVSPKYIDNLSLLGGIAAQRALDGSTQALKNGTAEDFAVIIGSAFGAIDSTLDFDAQALQKGPNAVNPMDFPNTVANAAGSRIGIWLQLKGPNVTLTNGGTSFIDAIGFALEGYNNGLFQRCLMGAVEKIPAFLKPLANPMAATIEFGEGACLFFASGEKNNDLLFEVEDYFALQLKPDFNIPLKFNDRFVRFFKGTEWLAFTEGTPLESRFPPNLIRYTPDPAVLELGLGGLGSINQFLLASQSRGIVGVFSKAERKFSLIKITKNKRST